MSICWYKSIKAILKDEPELWLAYLHGQQLENIPHLVENKPRYRGLLLQLLKFFYSLISTWRPFKSLKNRNREGYLVFAGTSNQIDSLDSTVESLRGKGAEVTVIVSKQLINGKNMKENYSLLSFSLLDILKILLIIMLRGSLLYKELKTLHPMAIRWWLADFLSVYAYLVYFHRTLSQLQPSIAITANDHNVSNRCMLAVAHQLNIKTVYLQHASVSSFFPALRVTYAFLDGQCALDIYRQCENNKPETYQKAPLPQVLLTGQKKQIIRLDNKANKSIGIALNRLDNIESSISFISELADMGYSLVVRWHPGHAENDVKKYLKVFARDPRIVLSDPKNEHVDSFLSHIVWLVASNSSIHLEAALANVVSIYYEISPANTYDYYGYVRNGLAVRAESVEDISQIVKKEIVSNEELVSFIRYYSATYKTEWEGREGELVAQCLDVICKGGKLPIDVLNL